MKAKLVRILNDNYGYGKTAFYSYRSYEYMVHFCNNGCMDDMNVKYEHQHQQEMIDMKIKNKGKEEIPEKATSNVQDALDMFFDFIDGE